MLILLGGHALLKSLASWSPRTHEHAHGERAHRHVHLHPDAARRHDHSYLLRAGRRPFVVGLAHGMAGSAALMVVAAAAMPSPIGGLLYILLFGAGATAGMLLLSGLIGLPFVLTASRAPRALALMQVLAGVISSGLGITLL
jgi:hypothetical protein